MRIKVLSLFPKMFDGILNESIIKRAIDDKKVNIDVIDCILSGIILNLNPNLSFK